VATITFWKDKAKEIIDPFLFSKIAEDMARAMSQEHDNSGKKANKRTQIRRFYDEILRLDQMARSSPDKWDRLLPQIHMLTAKAAYARGRELVSKGFLEDMIKHPVSKIEDSKDLAVFANFFEAFMGFYRLHGPKS